MSKVAVGQFSASNTLMENSQFSLNFPSATDKNSDVVNYFVKIYWQPIYCANSGANYITIENTDIIHVTSELQLTTTGTTNLQATSFLNFDKPLDTDVRIYVVVTARDNINDHIDDPPILTSGYYYVIRNQTPSLMLTSAEWVAGSTKEIRLEGVITDYGFTTPGNLVDLEASNAAWQSWRTGIEVALGGLNITFNFKVSYSSNNTSFTTPASYDITETKELISSTPGAPAYTNSSNFSLTFNKEATDPTPIPSLDRDNSYFLKGFLVSSLISGIDETSTSILLTSDTPLLIMRNGILQANLPKDTTAATGGLMVARNAQHNSSTGQSLALYDLHTESGAVGVANTPSIGFFKQDHTLMASLLVRKNEQTLDYEAILKINGEETPIGGLSGAVTVEQGGTGLTSLSVGSFLVGKNSTTMEAKTAAEVLGLIGALPLVGGTLTGPLSINMAEETSKIFTLKTNNSLRWAFGADDSEEEGDNVGSNFFFANYDDDGDLISKPLLINRETGEVTISTLNLANTNLLRIGPEDDVNLVIGRNEVVAFDNEESSILYLNPIGGLVSIGEGGLEVDGNISWHNATMTGAITRNIDASGATVLIGGAMSTDDAYRIMAGGSSNNGALYFDTADDGNEPISLRQFSGNFSTIAGYITLDGNHNLVASHFIYSNGGNAKCWDTYDLTFQTS